MLFDLPMFCVYVLCGIECTVCSMNLMLVYLGGSRVVPTAMRHGHTARLHVKALHIARVSGQRRSFACRPGRQTQRHTTACVFYGCANDAKLRELMEQSASLRSQPGVCQHDGC